MNIIISGTIGIYNRGQIDNTGDILYNSHCISIRTDIDILMCRYIESGMDFNNSLRIVIKYALNYVVKRILVNTSVLDRHNQRF